MSHCQNSHDFKACRAGIIASFRCHSARVVPDVTRPRLANRKRTLSNRNSTAAARLNRNTTAIPHEAAVHQRKPFKIQWKILNLGVHFMKTSIISYLILILGSCVALQFRTAVVPLMTRWSTGGTEMTVRPKK